MINEHSPFNAEPDPELGQALREALNPYFPEAFVGRVMARLRAQPQSSWDDVLARWFWKGLAAASMAVVAAGWGLSQGNAVADLTGDASNAATVAEQLLDGNTPAAQILMASVAPDISQ